jgi:hypothetical protein
VQRARRIQGVVLAALLVASQTSAWLHAAAVAHATCLEHGETIHAGAIGDAAPEAVSTPGAPAVRGDDAIASAHEHCEAGALLRFREVALSAPVAIAFAPVRGSPRLHDDARATPVATDVYLVAPKTSPPRADV